MTSQIYQKDIKILEILGFELEILPIESFLNYYKECNSLNSFSERAFLKAVKIPPQYFLEQPIETQEELLTNREYSIVDSKLKGKYLAILKKDGEILNCTRVDYESIEHKHDTISLSTENLKKLLHIRDFVKEGFSSNFIPYSELEKGKYNLGLFIDFPLMLHKEPKVHIGFHYIETSEEDTFKNLYIEELNINDYQSLDMLIEEALSSLIKNIGEEKIIETLKDKLFLREVDEILIKLQGKKIISKSYVRKISKFIFKKDLQVTNLFLFLNILLSYEQNFNYNATYKIRNSLDTIIALLDT